MRLAAGTAGEVRPHGNARYNHYEGFDSLHPLQSMIPRVSRTRERRRIILEASKRCAHKCRTLGIRRGKRRTPSANGCREMTKVISKRSAQALNLPRSGRAL